ncbi:MAG: sulfite exporter TauE/SafE family protein [Nitrospina sp.]|nr:sulfite exporter TauE/SafE family protein [Nitrospina sp.]
MQDYGQCLGRLHWCRSGRYSRRKVGRERRRKLITLALAGIVIGIISSGSGLGGGFLVVPLLIFLGREAKLAVGTAFVFILMTAISSILTHYRLGNIDLRTGLILALGGVIGAQIGPHLMQHVSDQNFKRLFSVLLVITAVWLFANSFASSEG